MGFEMCKKRQMAVSVAWGHVGKPTVNMLVLAADQSVNCGTTVHHLSSTRSCAPKLTVFSNHAEHTAQSIPLRRSPPLTPARYPSIRLHA